MSWLLETALAVAIVVVPLTAVADPGDIDTTFGVGGSVLAWPGDRSIVSPIAMAMQPDGKAVVVGYVAPSANFDIVVARYNEDGTFDSDFGTGGVATTDFNGEGDEAWAVVIQPDGKIVVAGTAWTDPPRQSGQNNGYDMALVRYNSDGSLDASFGTNGKVTTSFGSGPDGALTMAVQPDGKIVVGGAAYEADLRTTNLALARYDSTGALDPTFGTDGRVMTRIGGAAARVAQISDLAVQSDGKIVVTGHALADGYYDLILARYDTTGSLDAGFGNGGMIATTVSPDGRASFGQALALQPDGSIVVAGTTRVDRNVDVFAVRYDPSGNQDNIFGARGVAIFSPYEGSLHYTTSIAIQNDGRVLVGGWAQYPGAPIAHAFIARLSPIGNLDRGFGGPSLPMTVRHFPLGKLL